MKFDQVKEHKKNIFFFKIHAFPYICLLQVFPAGRLIRSYSRVDAIVFKLLWIQNQPPSGVHRNRCSENMQQIYRRILMPKCDFNKIALQLYWFWNRTSAWVFSCKFAAFFRTSFPRNTSGRLLLKIETTYNFFVSWRNFHW